MRAISQINWKAVAALALIVAAVAVYAKLLAIIAMLAAVVAVSFAVNQLSMRIVGIELVTFATVVSGIVYGPFVGAVLGAVLVLIHLVFSGYFGVYYLWVVPMYGVAGFLAGQWSGDAASIGLNIILLVSGVNMLLTFLFNRSNIFNYALYVATNIVFNFLLFFLFGAAVVGVLR